MDYHSLRDVSPGSYKWRIKVRVIRIWRGFASNGVPFKGFNLLLLDDKKQRLHAFVPGPNADDNEKIQQVGKIFKISNFVVKKYKENDKFRAVNSDKQIMFTNHTEVEEIDENESLIEHNMFDFYDLEDLKDIANDNTFLTDVIGVMEMEQPLEDVNNKKGGKQVKLQFNITDGRCSIRVSFWDLIAKELENALKQDLEDPKIIIIASCRITTWKDEIDISSATATTFYINYNHYSVNNMRKMLSTPLFSKHDFSSQSTKPLEILKLAEIKKLEAGYLNKEVCCEAKIIHVHEMEKWYVFVCTSCFRKVELNAGKYKCLKCNRTVPYPEKRFSIYTKAADETNEVEIILLDREVRTVIGKDVYEVDKEPKNGSGFPIILKDLENKEYCIKLKIRNRNIQMQALPYTAEDIYSLTLGETMSLQTTIDQSMAESSTSTYHLDGLSQMNFKTPENSNKQGKQKIVEE